MRIGTHHSGCLNVQLSCFFLRFFPFTINQWSKFYHPTLPLLKIIDYLFFFRITNLTTLSILVYILLPVIIADALVFIFIIFILLLHLYAAISLIRWLLWLHERGWNRNVHMYICDSQLGNMHVHVQNCAINNSDSDSDAEGIATTDAIVLAPSAHTPLVH